MTGFFQADGCVTFVSTNEAGPQSTWTNWIRLEHVGTAYAIIGFEYGAVRLLVAGLNDLFPMMCWPNNPSCEASFPIVPIPMIDKSPVLAMEVGLDEPDHLYIASLESFWILDLLMMRPLQGFFKWAGKPAVRAYSMDSVQIVQTRFDLKGTRVLIVLSGAHPKNGRIPYSQPGLVMSLFVAPGGRQVLPVTDTLMDTSPLSFHQPATYPGTYFWTQINNASTIAYLNSYGGAVDEPNTHIELKSGVSLAPGFAQVTMNNIGLVSIGHYNNSETFYGLKLAYNPDSGPGVSITSIDSSATKMGRPLLFAQPHSKYPYAIALVRTMSDQYALEAYNFAHVAPPTDAPPKPDISDPTPQSLKLANTQDKIYTRRNKKEQMQKLFSLQNDTSAAVPHSSEGSLPPNCIASRCSFEEDGNCPPDHCWLIGSIAQFFCCLRPPIDV